LFEWWTGQAQLRADASWIEMSSSSRCLEVSLSGRVRAPQASLACSADVLVMRAEQVLPPKPSDTSMTGKVVMTLPSVRIAGGTPADRVSEWWSRLPAAETRRSSDRNHIRTVDSNE
jgi:hypothetical protein